MSATQDRGPHTPEHDDEDQGGAFWDGHRRDLADPEYAREFAALAAKRGPHTPEHDNWDQGGYCNALVVDENGDGDICGYRRPPAPLPDKEPAIVRRGGESMRGWALVDDRNSATRMAFRPFDSSGIIILDTTVWTVERLPRKELTPVEMAAFLGAAFPDFPDPHCDHHQTPAADSERVELIRARHESPRYWLPSDDEAWLLAEHDRLTALLAEQAATIERVREVADHPDPRMHPSVVDQRDLLAALGSQRTADLVTWFDQEAARSLARAAVERVRGAVMARTLSPQRMVPVGQNQLGEVIWKVSKGDEGTISAMGADVVAGALLAHFTILADGTVAQNIEMPPAPVKLDPSWVKKIQKHLADLDTPPNETGEASS